MDSIDESNDIDPRPGGAACIETAVEWITAEIERRADSAEHPLKGYQVVSSVDQGRIWIASAVGPCMDVRYTPLEICADRAWTWHCEDPYDSREVGWRISTAAEIVDLLAELVGCE